ncbi:HNH endonuclease [Candidatus Woesearchaeota archaeon]|jgi:hypothetical protein|nr:HNH endonuclease [Candidatus Woesearchaeota archaeon]
MFDDPFAPKRGRKNSNPFGGSLDFGLGPKKEAKPKRQPTKTSQKAAVFDKQNGKCYRCKNKLKLGHTDYHHLKFVSQGGKTTRDNLVALCANCHREIHVEEKARKADKKAKTTKKDDSPFGGGLFGAPPKRKKSKGPFDFGF